MSININYEDLTDSGSKNTFDIPIGVTFTGKIGNYTHKLFLRGFEMVVALDQPKSVWTCAKRESAPKVQNYQEVHLDIAVKKLLDD